MPSTAVGFKWRPGWQARPLRKHDALRLIVRQPAVDSRCRVGCNSLGMRRTRAAPIQTINLRRGDQRMLKGHQIALGFLIASALWAVLIVLNSDASAYYQICEPNQYTGKEQCAPHHLLYVVFWYGGYVVNPVTIGAAATVVIAIFTRTLWRSTEKMWTATKESADAAKLNAEALIDADRAHLYPVIKTQNLRPALRAAGSFANSPEADCATATPGPFLEFSFKNLGRAAAIIEEAGWTMVQREVGNKVWDYPWGVVVDPVVEGRAESAPPCPCILQGKFTIGDAKSAFCGDRPLYFVGFVVFTTSMDRVYEFYWRYANIGSHWRLDHYEERQRS